MFQRIIGYLKALFGIKMDQWEDPEVLLKQADEEMRQLHAKNREQAVQALTQKNNLQFEVDRTTKDVNDLQMKAEMALKQGNQDLALQLLREKQARSANLESLQASLANAIKVTEQIKTALSKEEERIRQKTAEAMALKTQWKQAQIENSINKSLDKWQTVGNDEAYQRASAKIANAQSESAARTELASTRLDSKIDALNDAQADYAASNELEQLKIKMGMAPPPVVNTPVANTSGIETTTISPENVTPVTAAPAPGSAEAELAQLEQKIGGSSSNGTGA
jgi:phage shock protein A